MPDPRPSPADERAAYRAWLRANHPDLGGDPEAFRAGLETWRGRRRPAVWAHTEIVAVRRRGGPVALIGRWRARRLRARRLR
ncbi:hypothetical protein [Actinomadura kijaniata]|uniref:hypothetical protein n=1 Tax=Actinomadura kijaniata TaxID=46161 RepID=UPI000833CDD0|nr:hypothetical protein [Actinomadura kijaniata]